MKAIERHEWEKYLKFFNDQNRGRPTRLGVFERNEGVVTDYWLESGLPLTGIDLDPCDGQPSIQITLGTFSHEIRDSVKLTFKFTDTGDEDGLDVCGADGRMTVLRFETPPAGH